MVDINIVLGVLLLALPFVGVFIVGLASVGWKDTVKAFGITALIVFVVVVGSILVFGDSELMAMLETIPMRFTI